MFLKLVVGPFQHAESTKWVRWHFGPVWAILGQFFGHYVLERAPIELIIFVCVPSDQYTSIDTPT